MARGSSAKKGAAKKGKEGGLLRVAERTGVNRGVLGGSKGWFYVGTGLWTLRTIRRMAERRSETLISEELKPGDRLVIANGRATLDRSAPQGPAPGGRRRHKRS